VVLATRGNEEKGPACANQTLAVRTGQAQDYLSDVLHAIEEANQVLPGEIVNDQSNRCGDGEGVSGEAGRGARKNARVDDAPRRFRQKDGELDSPQHALEWLPSRGAARRVGRPS
jgi:hypothetical protein